MPLNRAAAQTCMVLPHAAAVTFSLNLLLVSVMTHLLMGFLQQCNVRACKPHNCDGACCYVNVPASSCSAEGKTRGNLLLDGTEQKYSVCWIECMFKVVTCPAHRHETQRGGHAECIIIIEYKLFINGYSYIFI